MLTCSFCSYNTDRLYNLNRHIKHKHNSNVNDSSNNKENAEIDVLSGEKVALGGEKVALGGEKVALGGEKVALGGEKVALDGEKVALGCEKIILNEEKETLRCSDCYKTFTRYRNLLQHKSICKKVQHINECTQCHKVFAQKYGLYKHKKICKGLPLIPYVPPTSESSLQNQVVTTETDGKNIVTQNSTIHTQNNHLTNNTQINNTSNNTININVFPTSLHTDYSINTDHFTVKDLRKNIRNQSIFEAVGTSLRMVLQNPNNLPVKKKNLRSDNSYIHVGDNKWEIRKDNEVFGLISFHISRCFQVYLDGTNLPQLRKFYQEATEALEFVASDNIQYLERESIQMAKRIMDILLLRAYELQNLQPS